MSTPHETDADDLDRLRGEDGTIDARKINSGMANPINVSPELCASWRRRTRNLSHRRTRIAAEADFEISRGAVGKHVRGLCSHDVSEPPVSLEGGDGDE